MSQTSILGRAITLAQQSPTVRRWLLRLRFRDLVNFTLKRYPIIRTDVSAGMKYRIATLDHLVLSKEIFEHGEYAILRELGAISTFADLGANCGYFTLYTGMLEDSQRPTGIAIDAHPAMVEHLRWHVEENKLGVVPLWGLVGARDGSTGEFWLHSDAAGSSQFTEAPANRLADAAFTKVIVPRLNIEAEWLRHLGDVACDVLKIDIEGSEAEVLKREAAFVSRARWVIIEIHKWLVDVDEVHDLLALSGFVLYRTMREDEAVIVQCFGRPQNA